ncbi:uncharacterized protein LOC113126065 isoform X1 [Mastacembelus armatus]|uniref:uncharacterized protein LOC113126065 isoform X1 n=2 Tax=Mastacembelus armatus TaxID=205130 RepID=UPI000E454EAA|nr:uncharacterized protein LOC113126065 isoform X1 [Mastacembelus armatus]
MDSFETPYDDEAEFIECTVCDKSIRGETLYKIHLTTPGHLKKEDVIISAGLGVRRRIVPEFKDILQYLDYLKLDEPIIGLSYLDELPCNDPQSGLRYLCRLCHQTANLPEMVRHVIGRKHRQKYVELKRPDLVTWDKQSIITQGGKIIRARAEIIERQDGRGSPLPVARRGIEGKLNISRVPPRQRHHRDRHITQSLTQRDTPSHLKEFEDYQDEYSHRVRYDPGYSNNPAFHPEEPYTNRDRQMYQRKDNLNRDHMEEDVHRADYRESGMYRRDYNNPDYHRDYEEEYVEDSQRRAILEPGGDPRYDSREEMSHGDSQHAEYYTEEAPPYRRPYTENEQLEEFYSEEDRRGRVRSGEYQSSQLMYPEDEHQWECGRHDGMIRAGRQGSNEPEVKRSHDQLFTMIRDYRHVMRESHQEEGVPNTGPGRTGPPSSQRRVEVTRTMSDIPEPFRRFLKGASSDEGQGKRKRKSRFSDATAEEVEMTKEMFSDEYGPPNPKFVGHPRPGPHHIDIYQRGISGSEGVFDMLKNIEIENAEEADFLKNKLCSLLKEFKSKKSEKTAQNSQGRAAINSNYGSLKQDQQLSPRQQYERIPHEDLNLRRPDIYFKDNHRGRGWKPHEYIPDEPLREYPHSGRSEPRHSNRSHFEELFGWPEMSRTPHASYPNEPEHYPERFQEPMHPQDYQPAAEEYFDSRSSASSLHMERESRIHRDPRYSKNLDKITSTLLELVARK